MFDRTYLPTRMIRQCEVTIALDNRANFAGAGRGTFQL